MASTAPYEIAYEMMNDKLSGTTIHCILVNDSDAFTKATDKYISDISANELSDASYARVACTGLTITKNTNGHAVWATVDNVTFSALAGGETIEAAYFAIWTGSDSTSEIISRIDMANVITNGGDVTVVPDATDGIIYANG